MAHVPNIKLPQLRIQRPKRPLKSIKPRLKLKKNKQKPKQNNHRPQNNKIRWAQKINKQHLPWLTFTANATQKTENALTVSTDTTLISTLPASNCLRTAQLPTRWDNAQHAWKDSRSRMGHAWNKNATRCCARLSPKTRYNVRPVHSDPTLITDAVSKSTASARPGSKPLENAPAATKDTSSIPTTTKSVFLLLNDFLTFYYSLCFYLCTFLDTFL